MFLNKEVSKTLSKLDEDEKGTKIIRTLGGEVVHTYFSSLMKGFIASIILSLIFAFI